MISLIPLLPYYNPLPINTNSNSNNIGEDNISGRRNYGATRRVTFGVEVVACPTFIPEESIVETK